MSTAQTGMATEWLTPHFGYNVRYTAHLLDVHTRYQHLEVLDTPEFGHILRLDGALQCSEKDEFFYHEPLVHVPAMTHPHPRSALVIGGGDGGAAEELLKHPSIDSVQMVEIDEAVIEASARFLRSVNKGVFEDEVGDGRFRWTIFDGAAHVHSTQRRYDLIVLDLTDPGGASSALYAPSFYRACAQRLNPGGILSLHVAAPWSQRPRAVQIIGRLRETFQHVAPFLTGVPISGGAWLMAHCSQSPLRVEVDQLHARCASLRGEALRYYTPGMHQACMQMPGYLEELSDARRDAQKRQSPD